MPAPPRIKPRRCTDRQRQQMLKFQRKLLPVIPSVQLATTLRRKQEASRFILIWVGRLNQHLLLLLFHIVKPLLLVIMFWEVQQIQSLRMTEALFLLRLTTQSQMLQMLLISIRLEPQHTISVMAIRLLSGCLLLHLMAARKSSLLELSSSLRAIPIIRAESILILRHIRS